MKTPIIVLLLALLLVPMVLGAQNDSQGGGLPGTNDRVALVERVLSVDVVKDTLTPQVFFGGTEYQVGDYAKVFIQIDIMGVPVNNATCFVKIYSPSNTVYLGFTPMTHLGDGIYYYDLVIPNITGVFPVIAQCTYDTKTYTAVPSSITNPLVGMEVAGGVAEVQNVDGLFYKMKEKGASTRGVRADFTFSNITVSNQTFLFSLQSLMQRSSAGAGDPANDTIRYSLFNFSSGNFTLISSPFNYTGLAFETFNVNLSKFNGFVSVNNTVILRINDSTREPSDTTDTELRVDYLRLTTSEYVANQTVQVVRGGGELHVSDTIQVIINDLNEETTFSPEVGIYLLCAIFLLLGLLSGNAVLLFFGAMVWVVGALWLFANSEGTTGVIFLGVGSLLAVMGYFKMR